MATEATVPFQAFTLETVVQQSPRKVDSLCAWAGYVLAGLNDGSLLVYKRQDSASEDNLKWQVRIMDEPVMRKNLDARPIHELVNLPRLDARCYAP
jgi:hypothetical protein